MAYTMTFHAPSDATSRRFVRFLSRPAAYLLVGVASIAALLVVAQLTVYLLIATYANIAPYTG